MSTILPQIDAGAMLDIHEAMLDRVSAACGLTPAERARLIGAKQCIACGAYQDIHGVLPCGHDHDL
ncbi:hypothetical protein QCE62_19725 [Caballeronia sp. LZ033]|uniref:hypothetical protein n=1 Tax=Caballeronia sp. LZ033 TaxID=3038566 RepID=UPI00285BA84D|nr:hypothetical protein [Caballeronia sp. LZ033]MDR5815820.1 hypothetical protein [Caballeronia sp. LZ033]